MTRTGEPAWTFYGRQECGCCEEAANLLLLLLDGKAVTVRMIDLHGPAEASAPVHRLPALLDERGLVVWQGAFDSGATEAAWKAATERRRTARRPARQGAAFDGWAEPVPNGLQ